ncbi:hypothetical protein NCC49_006392 [Naganishia albida]|nr:hypothetical protein NCC49_006392 [Naganishia albida]
MSNDNLAPPLLTTRAYPQSPAYPSTPANTPLPPPSSGSRTPVAQTATATTAGTQTNMTIPTIEIHSATPRTPLTIESQWSETRPRSVYLEQDGIPQQHRKGGFLRWLFCMRRKPRRTTGEAYGGGNA